MVTKSDAAYTVRARKMNRVTRHLHVSIQLRHTAGSAFVYDGLLGHSLNNVAGSNDMELSLLGRTSSRDLEYKSDKTAVEKKLEMAMRERFETGSLFSEVMEESIELQPVSRFATGTFVRLQEQLIQTDSGAGLSASIGHGN